MSGAKQQSVRIAAAHVLSGLALSEGGIDHPRTLCRQTLLGLGKHVGPTHAKRVRKRDNVIHTHGSFSGKYPRDLPLRHA